MGQAMQLTPRLAQIFSHAYVLGGSPCSGKSTVAAQLARDFDLAYYKADDYEAAHLQRCRPDRHPVMWRYAHMIWHEIWSQPVVEQVRDEFAFYRERFELVLEDLAGFDASRPLLLEGAAFLPELVQRCGVRRERVLFMVPTAEFQVSHYRRRPWIQNILQQCDDPVQAFDNWMMRDQLFGRMILRQARVFGYPTMIIDGSLNSDAVLARVAASFALHA